MQVAIGANKCNVCDIRTSNFALDYCLILLTFLLITARLRMLAFEEADECNDNTRKATMNEHHGDWQLARQILRIKVSC
jgi:hypothetical protein